MVVCHGSIQVGYSRLGGSLRKVRARGRTCYGKWLRMQRDTTNDAVGSVGCPRCIVLGRLAARGVRYNGIEITQLGVNEVELLGLKDGLFFRLGSFGCHILSNDGKEGFEEPIQEDMVI